MACFLEKIPSQKHSGLPMRRIFTNGEVTCALQQQVSITKSTLSLRILLSKFWSQQSAWTASRISHSQLNRLIISSPHIIKTSITSQFSSSLSLRQPLHSKQSPAKTDARRVGSLFYWLYCLFTIVTVYAGMPNNDDLGCLRFLQNRCSISKVSF